MSAPRDHWLLRPSNASGWELWPPATHNGVEGHQHLCHRMISLTDEEAAPAAVSEEVTRLREALEQAAEALETYGFHDDACPLCQPVTETEAAHFYADTGRLPADESCDCGLDTEIDNARAALSPPAAPSVSETESTKGS